MIELARHIEILLLDNDCVIVPGLGGFVSHYIPAHWVENEQRFLPPYRTLGFNPKMVLNDGLLVQSYMQAYDATYPEAFRLVEQRVENVKRILEKEGSFDLHGIGSLKQGMTGEYTFSPIEAGLLSPSLYGLGALEIQTLAALDAAEAQKAAELKAAQKALSTSLSSTTLQEEEDNYNRRGARLERIWLTGISAACIALLIALFLTVPNPSGEGKLASFKPLVEWWNKAVKQETVTTVQMDIPAKTTETKTTRKQTARKESPVQQADSVTVAPKQAEKAEATASSEKTVPPTPTQATAKSHYYTIVLSCSYSPRNSEIFALQLAEKGYPESHLLTKGQMTRVVYDQFDSETEAMNALRSLRAKDKLFADGWIYEVK